MRPAMDPMDLGLHAEVIIGASVLSTLAWPRITTLTRKSPVYKWLVVFSLCFAWMHGCVAALLSSIPPTEDICLTGIYMCASFYGAGKFCVYWFFIERLHVIATTGPRHKNPVYVVSALLLAPFFAILVLQMVYHVDSLEAEGCHIGVLREAGIPFVVYDSAFSFYQTTLFAFIMYRYISWRGPKQDAQNMILRKSLRVVVLGSLVSFALSFLNLVALAIHEALHSNVCFFLCYLDVLGNACVITYLVRPVAPLTSARPENVSMVAKAKMPRFQPTSMLLEEDFEQELQTVAAMLKQMQAQGLGRATPEIVSSTETESSTPILSPSS